MNFVSRTGLQGLITICVIGPAAGYYLYYSGAMPFEDVLDRSHLVVFALLLIYFYWLAAKGRRWAMVVALLLSAAYLVPVA